MPANAFIEESVISYPKCLFLSTLIIVSISAIVSCARTSPPPPTIAATPARVRPLALSAVPVVDPALRDFDFDDSGQGYCWGVLDGEITENSAIALDDFLVRHACKHLNITTGGPGGDVAAAMRMGRSLRRLRASTLVVNTLPCLSSCVLVFVGGAERVVLHGDKGAIGVHSYYRTVASPSEADSLAAYTKTYNAVKQYFDEMRIPTMLLDLSYSAPPWTIRMLTAQQIEDAHLNTSDPVIRDVETSAEAIRRHISLPEFYLRRARLETACPIPGPMSKDESKEFSKKYYQCKEAVLSGRE